LDAAVNLCRNCGTEHEPDAVCAPHAKAQAAGEADRGGLPLHQDRWPPGTYGHSDYWLGYVGRVP
jgi:hypothetical protein